MNFRRIKLKEACTCSTYCSLILLTPPRTPLEHFPWLLPCRSPSHKHDPPHGQLHSLSTIRAQQYLYIFSGAWTGRVLQQQFRNEPWPGQVGDGSLWGWWQSTVPARTARSSDATSGTGCITSFTAMELSPPSVLQVGSKTRRKCTEAVPGPMGMGTPVPWPWQAHASLSQLLQQRLLRSLSETLRLV